MSDRVDERITLAPSALDSTVYQHCNSLGSRTTHPLHVIPPVSVYIRGGWTVIGFGVASSVESSCATNDSANVGDDRKLKTPLDTPHHDNG
mmetsp:Transcript_37923/g.66487  ORF Transcript_37923/g.66487 Transcript_37923/m.66487 type:complete len:91 (-) Transcript_37923:7-279(-)